MSDVINTYTNFSHVSAFRESGFPAATAFSGPSRYEHTVSSWAVAGCTDDIWYEYYMIEVTSTLCAAVAGTMKIELYLLSFNLTDEHGAVIPSAKLIVASPDTTQNMTSYTSSVSQTISGSAGMFGDTPTLNLGGSVTVGNSITRTLSDVQIINRCYDAGTENGRWEFDLADYSNSQGANLETVTQMLYRVPRADIVGTLNLRLDVLVRVNDHDNNGTAYHDRMRASLLGPLQAAGGSMADYGDRGADISVKSELVALKRPTPPAA